MISIRRPTKEELSLIKYLLRESNVHLNADWNETLFVRELDDGGLGSLELYPNINILNQRSYGKTRSEHQFLDDEGIPILASLNIDKEGKLFELDMWKVDYSPILSFPKIPV